jgi:hypothetical protein
MLALSTKGLSISAIKMEINGDFDQAIHDLRGLWTGFHLAILP